MSSDVCSPYGRHSRTNNRAETLRDNCAFKCAMRAPAVTLRLALLLGVLAGATSGNWTAGQAQLASGPARVALEQMSPAERANSRISVEFESSDGGAVLLGHEVERLWNGGQYDEALAQLDNLQARVGHVAIGNSWRKPVPTRETALWGHDVRIGNRDSLLSLSSDAVYTNFFLALRHSNGPAYYSVCTSTDDGATWAETFTWSGSPVTCLSAACLGDFFVAYYSPGENAQQVRVRRFQHGDGSAVEFSTGAMWVPACTLDVGDTAREVSFISSYSSWLFIAALVSDGSVLLRWGDWSAASWGRMSSGITSGASRGLNAAYNLGGSSGTWLLLSYLDTTDTLRIYANRSAVFSQRLEHFCGPGELTSISAYYDRVICAYEDASTSPQRVRYACALDGGDTWTTGTLGDTSTAADAPAVTAWYDFGGFFAVYRQNSAPSEFRFCQRADSGPWSAPVSVTDNEPYRARPCIMCFAERPVPKFAVFYLSDTNPVVRGAYSVSGLASGLAEQRRTQVSKRTLPATVVRGTLFLPQAASYKLQAATLMDITGRNVLCLKPGANDLSGLAPGVYFVHQASCLMRAASSVTKVVVTR
jgi:hypothetical protein